VLSSNSRERIFFLKIQSEKEEEYHATTRALFSRAVQILNAEKERERTENVILLVL